ncbi:MAG: D-alanyl-D-alanine carboxypeptidase [Thermocrispum sp.]
MPIAGMPDRLVGGTLRDRMRGTPAEGNVHAKTGPMTAVHALAGYVTAVDGQRLVFAMNANNHLDEVLAPIEDAVAVRPAKYRGTADTSQPTTIELAPRTVTGPRADLECNWTKSC